MHVNIHPSTTTTTANEAVLLHQNNVLFQENYKRSQNEKVLYNEGQKVFAEKKQLSDMIGEMQLHIAELENKFNPLNAELNPICYLLALLAHHFLHVSRIRVKSITLRLLMSYIYGAPILDVSRSHTTTQHSR